MGHEQAERVEASHIQNIFVDLSLSVLVREKERGREGNLKKSAPVLLSNGSPVLLSGQSIPRSLRFAGPDVENVSLRLGSRKAIPPALAVPETGI